jgi:hypothetical protein
MGLGGREVVLFAAGAAFASIVIEDDQGCLSPEFVELELRASLGDAFVDELATRLRLVRGDTWRVVLSVATEASGRVLWTRELEVQPEDCPVLPEVIAGSIERGVAELPDWRLPAPVRPPIELAFHGYVDVGMRTSPSAVGEGARFGTGGSAWIGVRQRVALNVALDVMSSLEEPVEESAVQFAGGLAAAGPGLSVPVRRHEFRVAARIGVGRMFYHTTGLDVRNNSEWWTRAVAQVDVGWAFPGAVRLYARAETPLNPVPFYIQGLSGDMDRFPEERLRVGLVVQIAGALRGG